MSASRSIDPNAIGSLVPPFGAGIGGSGPTPPAGDVPIRDAHVIVVGQTGFLVDLATAGQPPLPPDLLNLDPATADQQSITCDYLDPGDGSQLALALAAAAASVAGNGIPVDIRLRPCEIVVSAAVAGATGLVVPAGCRVIGAGRGISTVAGASTGGASQCVFALGAGASLEDLTVQSGAPQAAPGGAQRGVLQCAAGVALRRVRVNLIRSTTVNRVQVAGIAIPAPDGTEIIEDVQLHIDSLFAQAVPAASVGIELGSAGASVLTDLDFLISDIDITEFNSGVGSASIGVSVLNVEGGQIRNVRHVRSRRPAATGAFSWIWSFTSVAPVTSQIRAPELRNCLLEALDDEASSQAGFAVTVSGTPNLTGGVWGGALTDCTVRFLRNAVPGAILKTGFIVSCPAASSSLNNLNLTACKAIAAVRGFNIDTSGGTGSVRGVCLVGCAAPNAEAGYLVAPNGIVLRTAGGGGVVQRTRVVACDFSGINTALGIGLEIEDVAVSDTIACLNNLTTGGAGTPLLDAGTGSETSLNII